MSDTKRLLVLIGVALWCLCSLPFANAQELSPLPEYTEQKCTESVDVAANTIVIKKKGEIAAVVGGTTYQSTGFETSANWYDGATGYDNTPNDQHSIDTVAPISGATSVKTISSATAGSTNAYWSFAHTVFYAKVKVYISSTSSPVHDRGVKILGATTSDLGQGIFIILYYDTDHFEYNVGYRKDDNSLGYVYGGSIAGGPTISTDTLHTFYFYYNGGTGADGVVWAAYDSEIADTDNGIDMDTKAAAIDRFNFVLYSATGTSPAESDFIFYTDDVWVGDYDPR
jgi:hypothetical protein